MHAAMNESHYLIEYRMDAGGDAPLPYTVEIDSDTLVSRVEIPDPLPDWVKLDHGKCGDCVLENSAYCPIAVRLAQPIEQFGSLQSHAPCSTTVITPERNYAKQSDVQDALRSLFGLLMATSGCPSMRPFRFMARYHLPFATLEETVSRITSTYLMRQFFLHDDERQIPIDLKAIETLYHTMQSLNEGMSHRLKSVARGDGSLNAIVILNTYSSLIPIIINDELLKLKSLFS